MKHPVYLLIYFLCIAMLLTSCRPFKHQSIDPGWKTDLELAKKELLENDVGLINNSRLSEQFGQHMDKIIERLPEFRFNEQVQVELSEAIASLGQSHTQLVLEDDVVYPFKFFMLYDGLYVTDTIAPYKDTMYMKLVSVNQKPIHEIISKLSKIISHENSYGLKESLPQYLIRPSILKGLGILDDSHTTVEFTFVDEDRTLILDVSPVDANNIQSIQSDLRNITYLNLKSEYYRYAYIAESKAIYVEYNVCQEDPNYPMNQFVSEVTKALEHSSPSRLVLDLRLNHGGNSSIIQPLIDQLKLQKTKPKHIIVLIGRGTASSAIKNALDFKWELNAVLLGEPTNGDPNGPGEVYLFELPNTKFKIAYSSKRFYFLQADSKTLEPDIFVEYTIDTFANGVDPVFNAALSYPSS